MKFILGLLSLISATLLATPTSPGAVVEIGEDVPEQCWTDVNDTKVCHTVFVNNVRVLIYGTGW